MCRLPDQNLIIMISKLTISMAVLCLLVACNGQKGQALPYRFGVLEESLGKTIETNTIKDFRNKSSHSYIVFHKAKVVPEKIIEIFKDFELVDTIVDNDIPFLWLNSSSWEKACDGSDPAGKVRNSIIAGRRGGIHCLFKKEETAVRRIIFVFEGEFIIVFIEELEV